MQRTPILDALFQHIGQYDSALHVPGHKQGKLFPSSLSAWFGQMLKLDLTELPGLDNLHAPVGCIQTSQELAASLYGSEVCYYSVNGSTAGVMAAIAAVAQTGDSVLFVNRPHHSAWKGLILAGALPVFCQPLFLLETWEFGIPPTQLVAQTLAQNPGVKAIYVTSPTYGGLLADVSGLATLAHEHGIPLLVDEAHGAHLGIHPALPHHSVRQGADIVVQSTHKMLPALTQTAWVHCQGRLISFTNVQTWLSFLQSSSPSYLLLASLDAVQAWLKWDGASAVDVGLSSLAMFEQLRKWDVSRRSRDPFKVWIPTGSAPETRWLLERANHAGISLEYGDCFGALAIFRLDATVTEVERFILMVDSWRQDYAGPESDSVKIRDLVLQGCTPHFEISPREAQMAPRAKLPLRNAKGHILADMLTPYPPGVPVAWPGQRIDDEVLDMIATGLGLGLSIHGVSSDGVVSVVEVK